MEKKLCVNIVLLGPPGAGKGTQADILTRAYGLLHISTGDMLRDAVKDGGEVGKEAEKYMNSGELVPDSIVTEIVIERMNKTDAYRGVILDGYPRTRAQAESLDDSLNKEGKKLDTVLYFETSEEVAVQRLSGRRVCSDCRAIFHTRNMPPRSEGECDECTGQLVQRDDDRPDTVRNRLSVYNKQTAELVEYYQGTGLLEKVDGNLKAEELFAKIDTLFREKGLLNDDTGRGER